MAVNNAYQNLSLFQILNRLGCDLIFIMDSLAARCPQRNSIPLGIISLISLLIWLKGIPPKDTSGLERLLSEAIVKVTSVVRRIFSSVSCANVNVLKSKEWEIQSGEVIVVDVAAVARSFLNSTSCSSDNVLKSKDIGSIFYLFFMNILILEMMSSGIQIVVILFQ